MEPPVVTVVIPGRGTVPGEVLAVGEPVPRTPLPPSWWVGMAAVAVLCAGVVAVATYEAPAAPPSAVRPSVPRVTATALDAGLRGGPLSARFGLYVRVAPTRAHGDSGSPSVEDEVTLLEVTGRGLLLGLDGASLPLEVGPMARTGAAMAFEVTAQVSSCETDRQDRRPLTIQVRQGSSTGDVQVAVDGGVVRLLDRLVLRTCRRSFG